MLLHTVACYTEMESPGEVYPDQTLHISHLLSVIHLAKSTFCLKIVSFANCASSRALEDWAHPICGRFGKLRGALGSPHCNWGTHHCLCNTRLGLFETSYTFMYQKLLGALSYLACKQHTCISLHMLLSDNYNYRHPTTNKLYIFGAWEKKIIGRLYCGKHVFVLFWVSLVANSALASVSGEQLNNVNNALWQWLPFYCWNIK